MSSLRKFRLVFLEELIIQLRVEPVLDFQKVHPNLDQFHSLLVGSSGHHQIHQVVDLVINGARVQIQTMQGVLIELTLFTLSAGAALIDQQGQEKSCDL